MRNNQPVSGKENEVPSGRTIVSYADLKGVITMVNDNFVHLSGFSRKELLGQPHNIVRHPDMPSEVFRDMWDTLQRGNTWSCLVKNRCKNGDHYWVRANVSSLPDNTGYVSVRIAPPRLEIDEAELLYARMRSDASLKMDEGSPALSEQVN